MRINEKFNISPAKVRLLLDKISTLGIKLEDIEESISRGGGSGGQKINKTSNRIQLHHRPSGISVTCQTERERSRNRFLALRELVDRIELAAKGPVSTKYLEKEKRRKNKDRMRRRRLAKERSKEEE
jgi:peptide chain release factor